MNYTPRTSTDFIAIHCSDTRPSQDIGEAEIRGWHTQKGWTDIGYNIVIRRDGRVEIGRPLDYQGAHVAGFNRNSLGVCLVGGKDEKSGPSNNFTLAQFTSLITTLKFLKLYAPSATIQGHRDFPNVAKDCPCFDVGEWLAENCPELL